MDGTTQAFVTEIVSRRIAENWLYWLLFLASSFLAAFAGAYIKRRAENLATRDDFEELKRQLHQTTRLTEEIKTEIGHSEWKAREVNALLRTKLEEFTENLWSSSTALSMYLRKASIGEAKGVDTPEMTRLRALSDLYFSEFSEALEAYDKHCRETYIWGMIRSIEHGKLKGPENYEKSCAAVAITMKGFEERVPVHDALRNALGTLAAKRMQSLLEEGRIKTKSLS
ncbi:hypothetical protein [Cupriavidus sp. DL-D2]|uniref:hypothetical protein n=1 Tax=Cupriavidus sp. DL-D2 TaxID=3144974 RepID=UPI003213145F